MAADADRERLARRIKRERVRLEAHLPRFDPLRELDPGDGEVEQYVAVDVDLAAYETSDGAQRVVAAEAVRERADFTLYVPEWRRLYVLANDGECVMVGDGDAMAGEVAWAAVYRDGELVASHAEPSEHGLV